MFQEHKKPSGFSFLRTLQSAASSVIALKKSRKVTENELDNIKNLDTSLKIETFLIEGFQHESATYTHLLQDRSVTLNLYFILIGITASSLGIAYQFLVALRNYFALSLVLTLLSYGVVHFLFFMRFAYLEFFIYRKNDNMNTIRKFYIEQFKRQIPNIESILPQYHLQHIFPFLPFLGFLFIVMECLCFGGAAFVGTQLWLNSTHGILTPFPTDLRPYIFGLVIGIAIFLLNILFRRKIFAMPSKPTLLVK